MGVHPFYFVQNRIICNRFKTESIAQNFLIEEIRPLITIVEILVKHLLSGIFDVVSDCLASGFTNYVGILL